MIKRITWYIAKFRTPRHKQYVFVRPKKKDTERVVREVIKRHKEALKELGDR